MILSSISVRILEDSGGIYINTPKDTGLNKIEVYFTLT